MNTVSIDIEEKELPNFCIINKYDLENMQEQGHKTLLEAYPFKAYKNRMSCNDCITVQIPINDYLLFRGYGLIV
jgi:hypothetical protein